MEIGARIEMSRGYWAGVARALRTWQASGPQPNAIGEIDAADFAVQSVGVEKLLDEIDRLLLSTD